MGPPFARGTKLLFVHKGGVRMPVTYVKWMGFERSSLVVVKHANGHKEIVHIDFLKRETLNED